MGDGDADWLELAGKVALGIGVGALTTAGVVAVAKSGVVQSAVARWRRSLDEKRQINAPPAGTPLLVSLARGGAEHSGIFLGRSRVAELRGNGDLCDVSLSDFVNGFDGDVVNMRSGTRIFAACDDETGLPLASRKIVDAARHFIENVKKVSYSLFRNNCHMFTASCVQGWLNHEQSFWDWIKNGTFTIDRLDDVVSNSMNAGRGIAWIGVRRSVGSFAYTLTDDKIDRLKKEGKY